MSLAVASGSANTDDFSSSSSLVWPTVNLYPRPQDQNDGQKNGGSGAKRGSLGCPPGAGQMGQQWDTSESDQHLLQGGQVGRGVLSWSSQVELERDVELER